MSNVEQLKDVFADALEIEATSTDWETLAYRGIPEWDSVAHMRLIAEIEDVFDVMLETDDVIGLSSFTIAQEILGKHGIDFD